MKKIYLTPQCEQVVLNVNGDILDNNFGNQKPGGPGESDEGVGGFEAKETEWGDIHSTPWED